MVERFARGFFVNGCPTSEEDEAAVDALVDQARRDLDRHGLHLSAGHLTRESFLATCSRIGSFVKQYDGRHIWEIKPVKLYEQTYHSLNSKALDPHTECYEFTGKPPRYLALFCIDPGEDQQGGETLLAPIDRYFATLDDDVQASLRGKTVQFRSTDGLRQQGLALAPIVHPLIEHTEDGARVFRFSSRCMSYQDDSEVAAYVRGFERYFALHAKRVRWSAGRALIWDNHRVAHSRTAFSGDSRCLLRVWMN